MGQDIKLRLAGLACLIGSAALGWYFIWQPYQDMVAHRDKVEYSTKIFILVPALAVFGLFFLIGGARWQYRDAGRKRLTAIGWVLMAATAIISGLCFWWFQTMFDALGYTAG